MRDAILRKFLVCSAVVALAILVSGCSAGTLSETETKPETAAATGPAKLQPGDKITVYVYGEDKLSGEHQLNQSGQISLPLAGTRTVTIASLQPYYEMGELEKPGEFAYKSGLNVLTALAIAGGPTYRASRNTVQIQRRGEANMRDYPI